MVKIYMYTYIRMYVGIHTHFLFYYVNTKEKNTISFLSPSSQVIIHIAKKRFKFLKMPDSCIVGALEMSVEL